MTALLGHTVPRVFTPPLRELTRETSRGFDLADFADQVLGEPFHPWQEWLAHHALELDEDGSYRFRMCLATCARQNGKTTFLKALSLYRLFVEGIGLVLGVAQDVSFAREVWIKCIEKIESTPELAAEMARKSLRSGDEWFRLASGGRYKISAANREAGRGLSVDHLVIDEIRSMRDDVAWSALSKTVMARPTAQIWAISTAGDQGAKVLNDLRKSALSGSDPSIFLAEWSAPDGCELDDERGWAASNPGLGYNVSLPWLRTFLHTDSPGVFRAEILNQTVESLDGAIPMDAWVSCADPAGSLKGHRVVACLDVAPNGRHVTLALAAALPDGRVRVQVAAAWDGTEACRFELPGLLDKIKPGAVAFYPSGPAAALATEMRQHGAVEIKGSDVTESCTAFADLVQAHRVLHPGDPLLNAHAANAAKLQSGDSWRFSRNEDGGSVDALYAVAGAAQVARTLPAPVTRPRPMVV